MEGTAGLRIQNAEHLALFRGASRSRQGTTACDQGATWFVREPSAWDPAMGSCRMEIRDPGCPSMLRLALSLHCGISSHPAHPRDRTTSGAVNSVTKCLFGTGLFSS
jgi:hypothetical protein